MDGGGSVACKDDRVPVAILDGAIDAYDVVNRSVSQSCHVKTGRWDLGEKAESDLSSPVQSSVAVAIKNM